VLRLTRTQALNAEYETLGQSSVRLDDMRRFGQLDSKAPGQPGYQWVDLQLQQHLYVCGDGCLMEGMGSEAASPAAPLTTMGCST